MMRRQECRQLASPSPHWGRSTASPFSTAARSPAATSALSPQAAMSVSISAAAILAAMSAVASRSHPAPAALIWSSDLNFGYDHRRQYQAPAALRASAYVSDHRQSHHQQLGRGYRRQQPLRRRRWPVIPTVAISVSGNNNTINLNGHSSVNGTLQGANSGSNNRLEPQLHRRKPGGAGQLESATRGTGGYPGWNDFTGTFTVRGVTYCVDPLLLDINGITSYRRLRKNPEPVCQSA